MKIYTPPKNTLLLWRLRSVLFVMIAMLISSVVWFLTPYVGIISVTAAVLALFFDFWYMPRYLKRFEITVSDAAVIINSGLFFRRERIMPSPRLIYAERLETPIAHALCVSAVVFRAARAVTVTIELDRRQCEEIIERISL